MTMVDTTPVRFSFSQRLRGLLLLLCVGLLSSLSAQVKFRAEVSRSVVPQGDRLRITYVLEGAQGTDLVVPNLNGFDVLSGPNVASSMTIVNGRSSSSQRYAYELRAAKEGVYAIAPGTIRVNGKRLRSNSLKVRVEPPRATPATGELNADEPVMVRLVTQSDTAILGQPILLSVEVLSKKQIYSYSELNPIDFKGLRVQRISNFDPAQRSIDIDGEPFLRRRVAQYEVYPSRPGTIALGPTELRLNILKPGARRSFFFDPPTQSFDVRSDIRQVTVMPLPKPEPQDFSGFVGRWRFQGQADRVTNITTADALTYKLFVQGQGDVTRLQAPELKWPQGWRGYPPETALEQSVETDTGIVHTRVYEYVLAPTQGGSTQLSPTLSYYDTKLNRYVSWQAAVQTIAVEDVGGTLPTEEESTEAQFPISTAKPRVVGPSWYDKPWFTYAFAGMPLFALLLGFGIRAVNRSRIGTRLSPKHDPIAEGKRRLAAARAALGTPGDFYQEVRQALEQYAIDRLDLAASNQSESAIRTAFASRSDFEADRAEKLATQFIEARHLADRGLYGGGTDEEGRRAALQDLEQLLSN